MSTWALFLVYSFVARTVLVKNRVVHFLCVNLLKPRFLTGKYFLLTLNVNTHQ